VKSSHLLTLTAAVALFASVSPSLADDAQVGVGAGDLLLRARAVGVFPDVSGRDNLSGIHGKIGIDNNYIPEVDATYFFGDHFAGEIIAGTTEHNVKDTTNTSSLGKINLGHVWLLPPTVTGQWHPLSRNAFDPYVGAGVNYTVFYGSGGAQAIGGQPTKVSYRNGIGEALQFGVNYDVQGPWFVNVDVKKLFLTTTAVVKNNGTETTRANVRIDPWLVGVGVGYRF
jgi:outer membrane protein